MDAGKDKGDQFTQKPLEDGDKLPGSTEEGEEGQVQIQFLGSGGKQKGGITTGLGVDRKRVIMKTF